MGERALITESAVARAEAATSAPARVAVVALGAPGTGTGPLAGGFVELGARRVPELNELADDLLPIVGSALDDVLAIRGESFSSPAVARLRQRAERLLTVDRAPGAEVLVLDDPRACRLLPFWIEAFEGAGVEPRFVLAFRDPLEVAPLLGAQHGLPERLSQLLWLRYLIDAERESRAHRRCFMRYEALGDARGAIARISDALDLPLGAQADIVEDGATPPSPPSEAGVRDGDGPGELGVWTRGAYQSLLTAAAGGPDRTLSATLDRIAEEIDDRMDSIAPAIEAERGRANELSRQLERTRAELRRARVKQSERERAIAAIELQLEELIDSTSWRLTAPLRGAMGALRGLRRRQAPPEVGRARPSGDFPASDSARYQAWATRHDTLDAQSRAELRNRLQQLTRAPVISVVMAAYEPVEEHLRAAISSVRNQIYPHWELCIADDASTSPHVRQVLDDAAHGDDRIRVVYREHNGHISAASNSALALATGEFVTFLDHDDLLAENALAEVALELDRHPDADFLYSDEDRLDTEGGRCEPYFKPDWNPELLCCNNYLCHLSVVRRVLVERVGGFREGFEGSQDYDLFLRVTAAIDDPARIRHIPRVLYHWRKHGGSTAAELTAKPYAPIAGRRALSDRLVGDDVAAVEHGPVPTFYRVRYPVPEPAPTVSLIIPTKDGAELLVECVESIIADTDYHPFEVIVVDNGSRDSATRSYLAELDERPSCRVLSYEEEFNFSAINNFAARHAAGEVLGFVNDDIQVRNADWLEEMVSHAVRPEIGAVGAKLLYPDGRVQHGGIALGIGGVAGHMHKDWPGDDPGYFGRLISVQAVSAVTAACMIVARSKFEEVQGFEEENLAIAFNDVELCLRLREAGYRNLWTPYAVLWHTESASRGYEDTDEKRKRFDAETEYMQRRWRSQLLADPYYNPNLTVDLEGFEVAETPRI